MEVFNLILRKKIIILLVLFIVLLFMVGVLLLIHKRETNSSLTVKSPSLQLGEIAVAIKQPIKELAIKEQAVKEQAVKQHAVKKQPFLTKSKILDVPLINQMDPPQLYNGCEVTSLAMILNYNGYHVTKNELANKIKTVPLTYQNGLKGNPNDGFVGNIENGPGYAVYNGPIYELAREYAGDKAVNLTNHPFIDLLKKVSQGEPVWIITTVTFAPVSSFESWHTPEGTIDITFQEHSVVITGYDQNYIYINNPYGHKNERLSRNLFEEAWEQMGKQAVVIER